MRKRKLLRLQGYDYSRSGAYFVTICLKDRFNLAHHFGKIVNGQMILNDLGQIADQYWREIPAHYAGVSIDEFIVMPDHIHGIIWIAGAMPAWGDAALAGAGAALAGDGAGAEHCSARTQASQASRHYGQLSKIIKSFKNVVTTHARKNGASDFQWQRSFHDSIVRDHQSLPRIRKYIRQNPMAASKADRFDGADHLQIRED